MTDFAGWVIVLILAAVLAFIIFNIGMDDRPGFSREEISSAFCVILFSKGLGRPAGIFWFEGGKVIRSSAPRVG